MRIEQGEGRRLGESGGEVQTRPALGRPQLIRLPCPPQRLPAIPGEEAGTSQ